MYAPRPLPDGGDAREPEPTPQAGADDKAYVPFPAAPHAKRGPSRLSTALAGLAFIGLVVAAANVFLNKAPASDATRPVSIEHPEMIPTPDAPAAARPAPIAGAEFAGAGTLSSADLEPAKTLPQPASAHESAASEPAQAARAFASPRLTGGGPRLSLPETRPSDARAGATPGRHGESNPFYGIFLPTLAGGSVRLDAPSPSRVVTIYLAPWCPTCRKESAGFRQLRRSLAASGIASRVIVGDDKPAAVASFAGEFGPDALLDPSHYVPVHGFPEVILTDGQGNVVRRRFGGFATAEEGAAWAANP